MESFSRSRKDDRTRDTLLDAIAGKGAFSRFRDEIHQQGVRQQWFDYKERAIAEEAPDFLVEQGIVLVEDVGLGALDTKPNAGDDESNCS